MSDEDSGVDSGNESNEPSPIVRQLFSGVHLEPVHIVVNADRNAVQEIIEVDPQPATLNSSSVPSTSVIFTNPTGANLNNSVDNSNNSAMLCQDNYDWPTRPTSTITETHNNNNNNIKNNNNNSSNTNTNSEQEKMQYSSGGDHFDPNVPSTSHSDANVRVLGFKLTIDEDTMNNLHSFYQNNVEQHNYVSKMPKHKRNKYRVNYYQHEILEKKLRTAANSNDYEAVVRLLDSGINANAFDERKRTPLHFAACHGNFGIAYALLDHGANPNQKDIIGNTPLHLAVCSSKLDIVILLLKNGANCNASDNTGRTPLGLAKSKLNILSQTLANSKQLPTVNLKLESIKISIMLGIYFEKCKNEKKSEIDVFKERLEKRETNEEIEQDVNDLLKCLNEWSI